MKKLILLLLCLVILIMGAACSDSNSPSDTENTGNKTPNNSVSTDSNTSFLKVHNDSDAIKQTTSDNEINLAVKNDREIFKFNDLFSYSTNYTIDIYALTSSEIDYSKKEATLSDGYNHFQVIFKNLSDFSETHYDVEIFKDPGDLISKPADYLLKHSHSYDYTLEGRPILNVTYNYNSDDLNSAFVDGYACETELKDFNLKLQVIYTFGISTEKWFNTYDEPENSETIVKEYILTSPDDVITDSIEFPNDEFYKKYYWGNSSKNPHMTITYKINIYSSRIVRTIDYSQMDIFK